MVGLESSKQEMGGIWWDDWSKGKNGAKKSCSTCSLEDSTKVEGRDEADEIEIEENDEEYGPLETDGCCAKKDEVSVVEASVLILFEPISSWMLCDATVATAAAAAADTAIWRATDADCWWRRLQLAHVHIPLQAGHAQRSWPGGTSKPGYAL